MASERGPSGSRVVGGTGAYAGALFYQSRTNANGVSISGSHAIQSANATIYVPASALSRGPDGTWRQALPSGDSRPVQVEFTVYQATLFFNVYVFFQVWNQINCRSLTPLASGFQGLFQNVTFLTIVGTVIVVQIALMSIAPLADIFKVAPLSPIDWLVIIASTASVLVFAEVWRRVRLASATA